jgi:nucleotide-binding universal stress UspA family protein
MRFKGGRVMNQFSKILFPADISDASPNIAPWVILMAERFDAEIHLLFVARELGQYASFSVIPGAIEQFETKLVKGAETKIEEFAEVHLKGYPNIRTRVALGNPAEKILDYIGDEEIDLVIMGTHGRKGLERVFFGSVADRVVKMSPVPVLTINPYGSQKYGER